MMRCLQKGILLMVGMKTELMVLLMLALQSQLLRLLRLHLRLHLRPRRQKKALEATAISGGMEIGQHTLTLPKAV
jgi:hypothetical protein